MLVNDIERPSDRTIRRIRLSSIAVTAAVAVTVSACSSSGSTGSATTGNGGSTPAGSSTASQIGSASQTAGGAAAVASGGHTCSPTAAASSHASVAAAQKVVAQAAGPSTTWQGPTSGPKAAKGKSVVFVANNMANPGDSGVLAGLKQAAGALGWTVKAIDGAGTPSNNLAALEQALALKPAAIAVSSVDPHAASSVFKAAKAAGIPVIGNHTGDSPGPNPSANLFTNITSDPKLIAKVAAACAIVAGNGTAGVTISSCGSEAPICATKAEAMKVEIASCSGCSTLAAEDYPFEDIAQREAGFATADYQKYAKKLTARLAINDIYFDSAIPALTAAGVGPSGPPLMIAAGDGSPAAFARIRKGQYQIATVAEPLTEHGWQMADEINRALAGQKPSSFVTYPHLVTIANVDTEGGKNNTFDPTNGYQKHYRSIWGV